MLIPTIIYEEHVRGWSSHALDFGQGFKVTFQRTLRIPDDGKTYPLPPGLGTFPICAAADYHDSPALQEMLANLPPSRSSQPLVGFIPMYQREALWISFRPRWWKPNAIKIGIGMVDAISGEPWKPGLQGTSTNQDYLVCPPQPWLDGIKAGEGFIRQFVAMPLGQGYTVEAQVTGEERFGGLQIIVFEPKEGKFPDEPPEGRENGLRFLAEVRYAPQAQAMGLGAGGKMRQQIYPDPHGLDTWDGENFGEAYLFIVNSLAYQEITGQAPPPTPVDAKTYTQHGFPWFDLYDEHLGDLQAQEALKKVHSIGQIDQEKDSQAKPDESIEIGEGQVEKLDLKKIFKKKGRKRGPTFYKK